MQCLQLFFVLNRGSSLDYGLHNRADKGNQRMSLAKICFTNSVFLQSQQCIMNRKIFQLFLENYNLKFCVNG